MITLEQFLETQNTGVRQNPFKYKIVQALELFNHAYDDEKISSFTINKIKDGDIYSFVEYIPEEYYSHYVYLVEPDYDQKNACLYLRIIII